VEGVVVGPADWMAAEKVVAFETTMTGWTTEVVVGGRAGGVIEVWNSYGVVLLSGVEMGLFDVT